MSENNNLQIVNKINELLDGDLKNNALEFVNYLHAKQLTPQQWFDPTYWRVPFEENYLCGIVFNENKWRFWFWSGDYNGELDDKSIETVHDYVRPCINCTTDCQFGKDTTVFGKEFINTCIQFPIQFENPDVNTLECIKKLLEYWKTATPNNYSWHYR